MLEVGCSVSGTGYGLDDWGRMSVDGCSDSLDDGGRMGARLLVDDGVESVVGVGSVFNDAVGAVGFHQAVAAVHYVTVACLVLAVVVAGQVILDVVSVAVLGMGVEVGVDGDGGGDFGVGGGGVGSGGGVMHRSGDFSDGRSIRMWCVADGDGSGGGHQCGEYQELKTKILLIIIIIIALFILAELRPSGLLFHSTSKSMKYYNYLYIK